MSKVWIVTGSSRGLGRQIVEAALAAGHRLLATARRPEQLQDLVEIWGDQIHTFPLDVTDWVAGKAAVQAALDAFGSLDVVVNNAGQADMASIEDCTEAAIRGQFETVFFGVVNLTKAALPVLRAQGHGHIIQISSLGARIGTPGLSAYQSAKWAVTGFSTCLANEVAPLGVRVTIVEPGSIRTDMSGGSSMAIPPISAPYANTVGAMADRLREGHGSEPCDPAKIAQVVVEIAALEDPPRRLLVGSDACRYAELAAEALSAEDARWRTLSQTVDFAPGN